MQLLLASECSLLFLLLLVLLQVRMSATGGDGKPGKSSAGKKAISKMEAGSSGKKGECLMHCSPHFALLLCLPCAQQGEGTAGYKGKRLM
jgi:hypothetical protein